MRTWRKIWISKIISTSQIFQQISNYTRDQTKFVLKFKDERAGTPIQEFCAPEQNCTLFSLLMGKQK